MQLFDINAVSGKKAGQAMHDTEELQTNTYPAPHTGTPMFSVHVTVGVPANTHIPTLRGEFFDYCDDLNLDATFEPVRA